MSKQFEKKVQADFGDFVRAYFLKYPDTRLQVLDADPYAVEILNEDVMVVHRYKSLLKRAHWSDETYTLNRRAQSFVLFEKDLGSANFEEVSFHDGTYRKKSRIDCSGFYYNLISQAGLLHLRRLIAAVRSKKLSFVPEEGGA